MAKAFGFTEDGVKRIVDSIRRIERELQNVKSHRQSNTPAEQPAIVGKTNEQFFRGTMFGTYATVSVWSLGFPDGPAVDTGLDVLVWDIGLIPASKSPIAADTAVAAIWAGGGYVLIAADVC